MSTPATIPFASSPFTPSSSPASRPATKPWSPSDRDRLIYQWVKFDGHKQDWVARQFNVHQTTVSRIVERYERWIAHGGPSHRGSPSYDERLRAQRWLTFERNEWILASALRIAGEMECHAETSKSTVSHPLSNPSAQSVVRTETATIDRNGVAARYLRLAHRINMDQLKLLEREQLPDLEPLTFDDITCAEAAIKESERSAAAARWDDRDPTPAERESEVNDFAEPEAASSPATTPLDQPQADSLRSEELASAETADAMEAESDTPAMPAVHKPEPARTHSNDCCQTTCGENTASQKPLANAYAVALQPPEIATAVPADFQPPVLILNSEF